MELDGGRLASFSHLQRCILTQASRQKGEGYSQCPEDGPREEAIGRRGNTC